VHLNFSMILIAAMLIVGCSPGTTPGAGRQDAAPGSTTPKQLSVAVSEDPGNMWDAVTGGGGSGVRQIGHSVNSFLATTSADGSPVPRLLAELPSVDRGTWRATPDGRMETTLKLRPDARWHDGQAFTADDVVFTWQVNRDPDVPNSNQAVPRLISGMEVQDATTVLVRWSELYPFADRLGHRELFTLPRHLLERPYQENKDTFLSQSYFSDDYVGLGPYRITRWSRGSQLEVAAFDNYFLGRPKIDTIRIQFIADPSTTTANMHARAIQFFLSPGGPDFEAMALVKQDWESSGYGSGAIEVPRWRFMEPQKLLNPQPAELADARARQALLHAIDRPELARAIYGEFGQVADSWVHPGFKHYAQVQDAITRYPYDPRRASALLGELGWRPGADGVLEKDGGQRFTMTIRTREDVKEALIIADNWKQIGVVGTYEAQTAQELRDREARARYTGMDISRGSMPAATIIRSLASEQIPTAENRWAGSNRGGYASRAWDELGMRYLTELVEARQVQIERDLVRLATVDLPLMPLVYDPEITVYGGGLTGVAAITGTAHNGQIMHTWNVHEWDLRSR
jgi:peptide/nickel transport system substrate-binding protein